MPIHSANVANVMVSVMARSVAFFQDGVCLPLEYELPARSEFLTECDTLALYASGPDAAAVNRERAAGDPS